MRNNFLKKGFNKITFLSWVVFMGLNFGNNAFAQTRALNIPEVEYTPLQDYYSTGSEISCTAKVYSNGLIDTLCAIYYTIYKDDFNTPIPNVGPYGSVSYKVRSQGTSNITQDITTGNGYLGVKPLFSTYRAFTLGIFDNYCVSRNRPVALSMTFNVPGVYKFNAEIQSCTNGGSSIFTNFTVPEGAPEGCAPGSHSDKAASSCDNPTALTSDAIFLTICDDNYIAFLSGDTEYCPGEVINLVYTIGGNDDEVDLTLLPEWITPVINQNANTLTLTGTAPDYDPENPIINFDVRILSAINPVGCPGATVSQSIIIKAEPIWTGTISSNWSTTGNWSTNTVPTEATNAFIPVPAEYTHAPVVNEPKATPAICNNLTIETGAVLTIFANKAFTVSGDIVNNGTIHVESTELGDGSLLSVGAISGTGTYNVDRYLEKSMWHLVTSPITEGLSGVMLNIWLRAYDEATNNFGEYITPTNIPMTTGQGFSVWTNTENEIRTFSGIVNDGALGPWNVQLTGTPHPDRGWNLIGNPYPSAIDWNAVSGWTKNNIGGTIYVWNRTQYATYNGSVGTNGGSRYIAMGQGFFVQASANSGANIGLSNDVRVHNTIPYRNNTEVPNLVRVSVEGNSSSDEAVLYYVEGSDEVYDFNYDAKKLYGNSSAPQLYTKKDENILAINSMSDLQTLDGKLVYLEVGQATEYSISYDHNLIEYSNVLMRDLATNAIIYPNSNYVFTAQPDDDNARFEFFLETTDVESVSADNISVWTFSNVLHVEVPQNQTLNNISLYDMQGKLIMTFTDTVKDLNGLAPAIYIVKVNVDRNSVVGKVIVE